MQDMLHQIEPLIPALRRYARSLLRDRSAADDLVQDCLERAVSNWSQRKDGNARAWIFTILHNLAMTRLRRTSTRPRHVELDDAQEGAFAQAPSQEDGLRYRELLAALDRLPEEQKAVLLLATVEGLSYAETAGVLDIPLGTVMSRLSRARERLLKEMDGQQRVAPVAHLRSVK
ncbi:MAG: sigma factor [Tardiphaga sp.]|uniref:sigma-70 family RNA polymerase sigma factor n=1 Tax=Tardiphaga sp. TaxID=1926292 RepID=UPI002620BDCA|nr:sigma-70 family RNA polymerase sigma factor [Tardiphaga sp.]MDB5503452.1 sigma factor [Tardiphaga sp.]